MNKLGNIFTLILWILCSIGIIATLIIVGFIMPVPDIYMMRWIQEYKTIIYDIKHAV